MNRWVPHRLRVRLTLWSVTVTVFVLGVCAAGVFFLVQRNASSALDDRLRSDFRWATEMAEQRSDGTLAWFDGDEWSEESPWLQVWSAAGELVYQTAVARRLPVPQSSELARRANGQVVTVPTTGEPFRMLAGPATVGNRPVVVQVGRSEALMRRELRELALVLLFGLPLSVAAAAVGGYSLARRALGPVDGMVERARAVTTASLSDRIPIDNPNDELGRLASVFNTMLGRLESSFEQMRSFAADVSHELRTPLTAIRSVGEVALREPRNDESYRAAIGSMLEDVDRLTRLTERLLLLSRADSGQLTLSIDTVDLRDLADDVTGQLGVLAEEKHQSMTIELEGRPVCQADQVVLRQAVINLVDNAIKFTPNGWHHPYPRRGDGWSSDPGGPRHRTRHTQRASTAHVRALRSRRTARRCRWRRPGTGHRQVGRRGQPWETELRTPTGPGKYFSHELSHASAGRQSPKLNIASENLANTPDSLAFTLTSILKSVART